MKIAATQVGEARRARAGDVRSVASYEGLGSARLEDEFASATTAIVAVGFAIDALCIELQ